MVRIGLLAALVLTAVGCGGGDPCAGSRCPNDTKQTTSDYQSCVSQHQRSQSNRCYPQTVAYELCIQASQVCGSDGRTDGQASGTQANLNCKTQADSVLCCVLGLSTCR